ncbi:hypothetical protein GOODEAATRI_010268 [Goodea atripinnis]|uniref:Uncharacterized protein n=1 Tax=Goodea atripinnis TaxID=208336 RepID=A0ABV0PME9_9TELE
MNMVIPLFFSLFNKFEHFSNQRKQIYAMLLSVIIYIFWQLTQGRKELIVLLRQQIVNVLLARQQLEEEERRSASGVAVPSDISTSDAMMQAMLARQKAERQDENFYKIPNEHPPSLDAVALSMAARQRAEEEDEYWSMTDFNQSNPVNRFGMQARERAGGNREDDPNDALSPVSSVMIQVMQARQRAEEEERSQSTRVPGQNPAPSGSSALIQAMLARQQAQNEYDDGY